MKTIEGGGVRRAALYYHGIVDGAMLRKTRGRRSDGIIHMSLAGVEDTLPRNSSVTLCGVLKWVDLRMIENPRLVIRASECPVPRERLNVVGFQLFTVS